MTSGDLLRAVVSGVFVMTFKSMGEWGVAVTNEGDTVLTDWPGATYFKRRCAMERAVDDRAFRLVVELTEHALAGEIRKFPCGRTAGRIVALVRDVTGQDISMLAHSAGDGRDSLDAKSRALKDCVGSILLSAYDRPEACMQDAVDGISRAKREFIDASRGVLAGVGDESVRYVNLFHQSLHLEDGRETPLALADVFVRPRFRYLYSYDERSAPMSDVFEVVDRFAHGRSMESVGDACPYRVLTILGQPGVGKTSLMAALVDEYRSGGIFQGVGKVLCLRLSRLAHTSFYESLSPIRFIVRQFELSDEDLEGVLLILDGLDDLPDPLRGNGHGRGRGDRCRLCVLVGTV